MNLEIEAKIPVPALEPIRRRLEQIGAACIKTVQEKDLYLKDPEGRLFQRGSSLRLRQQKCGSDQTSYLTYKGPKLESRYKSRAEAECQISDYDTAVKLFHELGYVPFIQVEKKRVIWKWEKCLICLDEVSGLGCFIEVEGPDENEIEKTLDQIHLSDCPHISEGYARLTAEALEQNKQNLKKRV